MILGAIGDDFTGSSDLGLILAQGGMRTVQYIDTPTEMASSDIDAGVIALKTRSIPLEDAISQSIKAFRWLRNQGCKKFMFKYCSTFDSTPRGNIGPVIDALISELDTNEPVIVCPAFPETGRSIYMGHLFVNDKLLSESGLEKHPLTPMTDADIRRWLQYQTEHQVGHVRLKDIKNGSTHQKLLSETANGRQLVICDAIENTDLFELAKATENFPLITGGSGIALGIPGIYGFASEDKINWSGIKGPVLALSGSCSQATRGQVFRHKEKGGVYKKIEAHDIIEEKFDIEELVSWALQVSELPLIYTSDEPENVLDIQKKYGREYSAQKVEEFFASVALAATEAGFKSIISAGGETSGAVVKALKIEAMEIGPKIAAGVPALKVKDRDLAMVLKSGNFGSPDFFEEAANILVSQ